MREPRFLRDRYAIDRSTLCGRLEYPALMGGVLTPRDEERDDGFDRRFSFASERSGSLPEKDRAYCARERAKVPFAESRPREDEATYVR